MTQIFIPACDLRSCHRRQTIRELIVNQQDGSTLGICYKKKKIGRFGGERPVQWFSLDRRIPGRDVEELKTAISVKALGSEFSGGFEG